jgi:signal transduction histidine kinase
MAILSRRVEYSRRLAWLIVALVQLASARPLWAQGDRKSVLVLYSTRRDAQIVSIGERELPRDLEAGLGQSPDYYSEYVDRARFPDPEYRAAFREFLLRKYHDIRFDVIIALDVALQFLGENRNDLFPNTPVVFFSNTPRPVRIPDSTGVATGLNFAGTLTLASALQPDLRSVFVVLGAGTEDEPYHTLVRDQLQRFGSKFTLTYLAGLPTADLEARLAALPPHSMVYYIVVDQDGAGEFFHPLAYLDRVVKASNAPVYCWVDSAMEHGIVGGSLKDQTAQMRVLAELAVRVLKGERADGIPLVTQDLEVPQVDWRQLQRWGISEGLVPKDTLVKFRDPSVWDRYKYYIGSAAAVLVAQSALIAGLLVQRTRRRRAEDEARISQAELQASYARIHDLGGRLLGAQESERARIARELHDDIGQQIALLAIDLELLGASHPETIAMDALNRAQGVARSVHDLSHRLHPAKLRLIGLVAALTGLQHEPSHGGIPTTFTHDNVPGSLPPDVTLCLFRIVQEALQNATKYSGARIMSVHLRGTADGLVLTVDDDGRGFDVDAAWGTGLGLMSMSERVEAVGGTLQVDSVLGTGTHLEVKVPLRTAPDAARADSA